METQQMMREFSRYLINVRFSGDRLGAEDNQWWVYGVHDFHG